MPITNNNIPGIDMPPWEVLQPMPYASTSEGYCVANDLRGSDRFIYAFFSNQVFYRYDTWANSWQLMAQPAPSISSGYSGCMAFDPSQGSAGCIWLLFNQYYGSAHLFKYDIAANTWTEKSAVGLPTLSNGQSVVHPCTSYDAGGDDDALYLITGSDNLFYKYSIYGDIWTSSLATSPASLDSGKNLAWVPGWDPNKLIAIRGYNKQIYVYNISANSWSELSYYPNGENFIAGTYATPRGIDQPKLIIHRANSAQILELNLNEGQLKSMGDMILPDTMQKTGNRMAWAKPSGIEFLYVNPVGDSAWIRTPLFF